jgi:hypothetical protein
MRKSFFMHYNFLIIFNTILTNFLKYSYEMKLLRIIILYAKNQYYIIFFNDYYDVLSQNLNKFSK